MRAGCSASTFNLVASWENPCTQVVLGTDSHTGKGPLDADVAVRTTGLLTAGRNRGAQTKTFSGEMMTDKLSLY